VKTSTIELQTVDGPMATYEAVPSSGRGAVVVIQEAFGVNPHIQDVARRLAAEGFHVVAPALFHRTGGGTVPYDDFPSVMAKFAGLDDSSILVDVDAALTHLEAAGWRRSQIGVVGFCMGGRVAFLTAARRSLGAAVSFYGGGIVTARFPQFPPLVEEAGRLQTPWLGLFGDLDQSIPVDDVEVLAKATAEAPVDTEVVRYAEAGHGFHCDARPDHYERGAATDAWGRTLTWFSDHLR